MKIYVEVLLRCKENECNYYYYCTSIPELIQNGLNSMESNKNCTHLAIKVKILSEDNRIIKEVIFGRCSFNEQFVKSVFNIGE